MTTNNRSAAPSGRTSSTPGSPGSSGADGPQVPPAVLRRATVGAAVGSIVEWFDVAVYAYLAAVIGSVFFSTDDPTVALLSSFAVFGAAFVVRPLGGIFFGALGDRVGRQRTLAWVILLVSGATLAIGLLPGYATLGVAAPILLVVLRLLQGFSAGGEMGGASAFVAEYSPPRRRGLLVSWVEMGCIVGFLLGSVVVLLLNLLLTSDQVEAWGWRIPFLLAAPLGLVGLYIRSRLEETPEFAALREAGRVSRHPLLESVRDHWPAILRTAGYALFQNAALYVILTFVPTFQSETLGYSSVVASTSSVVSMCVICAMIPLLGAASDRLGRRPVPAFGGTAPFLVTLLVKATGNDASPAFYVMAAALVTLPIVLTAPETAPARAARTRVGTSAGVPTA